VTFTSELAAHFSRVKYNDLPNTHVHEMKRLMLDFLGVGLNGSRTDSGRIVGEFAVDLGGPPESTVLGRAERVTAVHAAFANAVSSHSIELDDVDDLALFHYGPPVIATTVAVAQLVKAGGEQTLAAALAGCEMMNRLSLATNNALRDRGFHTTPTCGVFGATVAAGHLLGLSSDQLTSALGLAGAQASGLMEMYGISMQKRINPGPAARNGVTAALLARKGYTGADTILEGERGFGAAFAGKLDTDALMAGLGTEIPVAVEYKPYSCARPIHNAIDCALQLRVEHGVGLADIEKVVVRRHPDWANYHLINKPRTYHEAQVSLPYSVAIAFADGSALPAQYSDARLRDTAVMSLAERVVVEVDATLPRGVSCRMTAITRDGRALTTQVDHPKGSAENPLTDDDLVAKFTMLTDDVLPSGNATRITEQVLALDEVGDINELIALTH
jgi:2-methylcitrate dehydratase PrpD